MVRRRRTIKKNYTQVIIILIGSLIGIGSIYITNTYPAMFGFAIIGVGVLFAVLEGDD